MSVELRGSRPVGASGTRREQCTRCRRQTQAPGLSRVNIRPAGSSPRCIASSHRTSASVCRAVRHVDAEALWPSIDDSGDDALPRTRAVQQTLLRSFVISGIGLHTAEMANVRVRPAFANEGRYFVIVPEGTIGLDTDYTDKGNVGITYEEGTALFQAKQLELFQKFLREEEAGYSGGFEAFCSREGHPELVPGYDAEGELPGRAQGGPEAPQAAGDGEVVIAATAEAGVSEHGLLTSLRDASGAARIHAVQHLLGVLEACGVDNCRIEIEGGTELPVLDGSGLQWWRGVVGAGVVPAVDAAGGESVPKLVWRPTQLVTVSGRGHAFATLYPEPEVSRLTYGLNHSVEAPIIGKLWMSWCVQEDGSIGPGVVAARAYAPSVDHLYQLRDAGFLQAGTVGRTVVADGEDWLNEVDVRFHDDEPVRHRLLNLLGDLALLNRRGNGGVPLGHVVVHDADHQVHLQFCKALLGALTDDDLVPFPEPPPPQQQQQQ